MPAMTGDFCSEAPHRPGQDHLRIILQAEAPPTEASFLPSLLPQVLPPVHVFHILFHFDICFLEDLS